MAVLLVADLHLHPGLRDAQQAALEHLLFREAAAGDAIHFLGDLFHLWFERGDRHVGDYEAALGLLARASSEGRTLSLVRGNRDFAAGRHLADRTGMAILPDIHVADLAGERAVLTHGDLLCTRDYRYRLLRWVLTGPVGRAVRVVTPWAIARRIVTGVQRRPKVPICHARAERSDLVDAAAAALLRRHDATRIYCGHRHADETRPIRLDGRAGELRILPSWRDRGAHLRIEGTERALRTQAVAPDREGVILQEHAPPPPGAS
jgi:UDP-2,3-diacylglucosamine hydrolase